MESCFNKYISGDPRTKTLFHPFCYFAWGFLFLGRSPKNPLPIENFAVGTPRPGRSSTALPIPTLRSGLRPRPSERRSCTQESITSSPTASSRLQRDSSETLGFRNLPTRETVWTVSRPLSSAVCQTSVCPTGTLWAGRSHRRKVCPATKPPTP